MRYPPMSRRRGLRSASGIAVKHKPRHHLAFATQRLEGGLFLPDQLEKAALGAARFQSEADYHTPKGLKLKDDYSRAGFIVPTGIATLLLRAANLSRALPNQGTSSLPRIDDGHAGRLEVGYIPGHDGHAMHKCGGCDICISVGARIGHM